MHEGETREVIVEFVRKGDRVATLTTTLPPEMVPVAVARGLVFAGGLAGVLYAFER